MGVGKAAVSNGDERGERAERRRLDPPRERADAEVERAAGAEIDEADGGAGEGGAGAGGHDAQLILIMKVIVNMKA